MLRLIFLIFSFFLISCSQNRQEQSNNNKINQDSFNRNKKKFNKVIEYFKLDLEFQIVNVKKGIDNTSTEKDTSICKSWSIKLSDLKKIILDLKPMGGTEWDLSFQVFPCIISGQIIQNGAIFDFELDAGAWMVVYNKDTSEYFGNFKRRKEKYFLSKAYEE